MPELTKEQGVCSSSDFNGGKWQVEINVRDFIQRNYTPYYGDSSFFPVYGGKLKGYSGRPGSEKV